MARQILIVLAALLFTIPASAQVCTQPPANLTHWWPAEGNAADIQGGSNGTLQNNAGFAVGKVGQAFSLDNGARVDVADNATLNPGMGSFSVAAWVYKFRLQGDLAVAPPSRQANR